LLFQALKSSLKNIQDDANAIIGHFGLGFYSSFMVSSQVEIISKSYREGATGIRWECDGSPEYTLEESDRAEVGTDIVMHINSDSEEFLDKARISGILNKYCKFLQVPVVFGKKTTWKDGKDVDTDAR